MSIIPFRFIQASDFHLEQPLHGVCELTAPLRELFVEAPYWAAERVFDAAISEHADFLILAGDLLDVDRAGPRGPMFLCRQFQRLAERKIPIYWAPGAVDPATGWPSEFPLPENVHRFSLGSAISGGQAHFARKAPHNEPVPDGFRTTTALVRMERGGRLLARISMLFGGEAQLPGERARSPDVEGGIEIATWHGQIDDHLLQDRRIDYWALGGRHARQTLLSGSRAAHYSGSPQGRNPQESDAHGCTLVELDATGQFRLRTLPCDLACWKTLEQRIHEQTTQQQLLAGMRKELQLLATTRSDADFLISWELVGQGPLMTQLRRTGLQCELIHQLNAEFSTTAPRRFSVSLEPISPPLPLPADVAGDGDSLRSAFLDHLARCESTSQQPLDYSSVLGPREQGFVQELADWGLASDRQLLLRDVAILGAELLTAEGRS